MEATSKREAFEIIYQNLTDVQNTYRRMIYHCSKELWEIKTSEKELTKSLTRNIKVAEESFLRLERIKYQTSIAILTEGVCASEDDLSQAITEVEELLQISEHERDTDDDTVIEWADNKIQHLENTKGVLLQVLSHKMNNKVKRNFVYYQ